MFAGKEPEQQSWTLFLISYVLEESYSMSANLLEVAVIHVYFTRF